MDKFLLYHTSLKWTNEKKEQNGNKQLPEVFYKERCSKKFRKIHRKISVSESLFQ